MQTNSLDSSVFLPRSTLMKIPDDCCEIFHAAMTETLDDELCSPLMSARQEHIARQIHRSYTITVAAQ